MDAKAELQALISDAIDDLGLSASASLDYVAEYAAERANHLAAAVGEPGFMQAVEAEARNVSLRAAIAAVGVADETDERFVRIVQGGLRIVAGLLAA